MRFLFLTLVLLASAAAAAPSAVSTFHSIGLYWSPPDGSESNSARVEFRRHGDSAWRPGLDLWFDARNREYRGSLVELEPQTVYEVKLTLSSGFAETITARTWAENFRIKKRVEIRPGETLIIRALDSGDEKNGYVLYTAAPGRNVIEGNDRDDACVVVRQGAHHVIIRGLVLKNCKRFGVLLQHSREANAQTHDVVIEANEISGWGAREVLKPGSGLADNDAAIHCRYYHESDDAMRPDRIVIQGNRIRDPRHGANPWQSSAHGRLHPSGPHGVKFDRCGRNHIVRYNEIGSANGKHYNDGIGGSDNFSAKGFPWADSDIYGNRISQVYDDAIEAEGANRNVRIWANHFDRVFVPIANAATSVGPLYVWSNVSRRTQGMENPEGGRNIAPFVKAGSRHPEFNGGRAYYFYNTALEPTRGIAASGGTLYNYVSLSNAFAGEPPARAPRIPNFSPAPNGSRSPVE